MASRKIGDICITVRHKVVKWLALCAADPWLVKNDISVLVTCTYRSNEEQATLYEQGRTKPGRIVTWAKPGQSKHNNKVNGVPASLAVDIVPVRHGRLVWGTVGDGIDENPADDERDDLEVWQRIAVIGKAQGLEWAGDWSKGKREFPHFQGVA